MKRILFLLMLLCSLGAAAQDVIVKTDGSTIVCRVVEVGTTAITYKKWSNLKGPNYVVEKKDVSSINYENGEKDVFDGTATPKATTPTPTTTTAPTPIPQFNKGQQTVSDGELLRMVGSKISPLNENYQKVKNLKLAGWVTGGTCFATGIVLISIGLSGDFGYPDWWSFVGPGIGCAGAGVVTATACLLYARKLEKKASKYSVQSSPLYQQDLHLKNGTTLSPSIDVLKDHTRHNVTLGVGLTYNI